MNLQRFEALAEAYGADINRWPVEDQPGARELAASPQARAALDAAADLDHLMNASRQPAVSAALRERVLRGAPAERARAGLFGFGWRLKAGLGAGLASAGLAGVVAGFALNASAVEPGELALSTLATPIAATAFGPAPEAQED